MGEGHAGSGGAAIEELARERLGFGRLRPGQLRAAEALVGGRDVLAVLPSGGGKSAIYELAGMARAGPTVVVSPLIALQDDQLAHLREVGLPAIVLNSQQSAGARAAALLASCDPDTFVFLSPEQLANPQTRQALERARPGLFVVDEAWGSTSRTSAGYCTLTRRPRWTRTTRRWGAPEGTASRRTHGCCTARRTSSWRVT